MNEQLKKEIVKSIIESGKAVTTEDISEIFMDLQSMMYQKLLESEVDIHTEKDKNNKRNGYAEKPRKVRTKNGEVTIHMPRDRNGSFDPIIVKKRQRVVDDFSDMAILLYSKGNTLEDIKEIIKKVYKIELSKTFLSDLISRVNEDIEKWQNRPLKKIYIMTYIDCIYCPIKIEGTSSKVAIYVIIGIDIEGKKEVIGIWIGDGCEASSFWAGILEELKSRGVEEIVYLSMDGLKGLKEAIEIIYPLTKTQRCIVHLVRNLYNVCPKKDAKEIISDYKKIYKSDNLPEVKIRYEEFIKKHDKKPAIIKKVKENIEHIYSLYEETEEVRKLIYTTNTIESVNSCLRKVTRGKGMFMNKESLMRVLYLRINDLEKKWSKGIKNWDKVLEKLIIQYDQRITKYL